MANLLKLMNGEEIIGEIVDKKDNLISIKNPLLLVFDDTDNGSTGIVLINYIPFSVQDTIEINVSSVITSVPLAVNMTEYYEKSVIYCRKYQDEKLKASLSIAISHLDNIIQSLSAPEKKRHNSKDAIDKIMGVLNQPNNKLN
jgi:hypothetical protein